MYIDKTKLKPYADESQPFGFYSFEEYREYVFRPDSLRNIDEHGERITEYQFVFNEDHEHIGMAKRKNKKFDIYFDGNWIDDASSINEQSMKTFAKCENFMVTYKEIYLEQREGENKIRKKVLGHNERYSSAIGTGSNVSIPDYVTERVKEHVCLFSGLIMIETTVFVSHGRFVSFYYLKEDKFVLSDLHFDYSDQIKFIFKRRREVIDNNRVNERFSVGVLLANGEFHVIENDNPEQQNWVRCDDV